MRKEPSTFSYCKSLRQRSLDGTMKYSTVCAVIWWNVWYWRRIPQGQIFLSPDQLIAFRSGLTWRLLFKSFTRWSTPRAWTISWFLGTCFSSGAPAAGLDGQLISCRLFRSWVLALGPDGQLISYPGSYPGYWLRAWMTAWFLTTC
jgi:hypothetical protein